ncbi:hypothetical protein FB645_002916 [Coemansia sp. IMI 203386]|nr:hypothetical protein FB645_002916 [Coemansia sp. IMI 203386]
MELATKTTTATSATTTATVIATGVPHTTLDKQASSFADNETESGAFRVDVCGHQYSIPSDQMDAEFLDAQLWELAQPYSQAARAVASKIVSKISCTVEDLVAQGPPPENTIKPVRKRANGRRQSRRTDTLERRRLAYALSRLGAGTSDMLDDLQSMFDLVSHELGIHAHTWRSFRVSERQRLGDGIEEFVVGGSDSLGFVGVAAPQVDVERPFSTGLAEFLVAAMNRHARTVLSVRHLWALLVSPGRLRLCLVEPDAIHIGRALNVGTAEGRGRAVELMAYLGMAEAWRLGADPSMRWREDLDRWEIDCPDDESCSDDNRVYYAQRLPLFVADSFFGRFTRCFAVSDTPDGAVHAVLKDSWQLAYAGDSVDEVEVLRQIRDRLDAARSTCVYPRLSCGGTVRVQDAQMEDTSEVVLGAMAGYARWTVPHGHCGGVVGLRRVHRRMVTGPIGTPLQALESEHEVVAVLADAMRAHTEVLRSGGVLHRDVSLNNVMAVRMPTGELRGMLIDYDHAVDPLSVRNQRLPGNIGTGPFMSIANLEGLDVARTSVDDWEALISLLFCLAARSHQALEQMGSSFARVSSNGVASVKREMFSSARCLDDAIAQHLDASGCPNIVRLIRALYSAIFQHPRCQGTVQIMLRGNRMVDPVLRRVQYAGDIQRRCLAALEAVAADVRSMGRLSDHLATISHESPANVVIKTPPGSRELCVQPEDNAAAAAAGSESPSPTETVCDATDPEHSKDHEISVPLSARSDVAVVAASNNDDALPSVDMFRRASMYQHSTTTTLHDINGRCDSSYNIVVNDVMLQAVARKRKAKEETQDSPRSKRRKMIHDDVNDNDLGSYSPLLPGHSAVGVFATPRSVPPNRPPKYRANSKLQRKLF